MMKERIVFRLPVLCLLLLFSCKKAENSLYEGTWVLNGEKKSVVYPCWPCITPVDPTTTVTASSQNIIIKDEPDGIIRFYGLDTNTLMTKDDSCQTQAYCGFYGTVTNDGFEINKVTDPGGTLTGSAILQNDVLELSYTFYYRNRTYTYTLKGKKQ